MSNFEDDEADKSAVVELDETVRRYMARLEEVAGVLVDAHADAVRIKHFADEAREALQALAFLKHEKEMGRSSGRVELHFDAGLFRWMAENEGKEYAFDMIQAELAMMVYCEVMLAELKSGDAGKGGAV